MTYGSAGNGSASHLATLLLAETAKFDMVHAPYKGAVPRSPICWAAGSTSW